MRKQKKIEVEIERCCYFSKSLGSSLQIINSILNFAEVVDEDTNHGVNITQTHTQYHYGNTYS